MAEATSIQSSIRGGVHQVLPHDSAAKHVSGEAVYVDDIPEPPGLLHAAFGLSDKPHARIKSIDLAPVRAAPGVVAVIAAEDVPGDNNVGPVIADEPVFAEGLVEYAEQSIFAVAAETVEQARRAARLAVIEYEELPAVLTVEEALQQDLTVLPPHVMRRGDARAAIERAPNRLRGRIKIGGQDHFYLEGQVSMALPQEDGDLLVHCSTQHPSEVQHTIAHALGCRNVDITVEVRRMGGGFGGKETQAAIFAVHRLAAGAQDRAAGQGARRPRRRHDHDRQAPRLCH